MTTCEVSTILERLADLVEHVESLVYTAPGMAAGRGCPLGGKCYLPECNSSYCYDRDAT